MKYFRLLNNPNITLKEKAKDFVIGFSQVMITFFVIAYIMAIFTDEYKFARDFASSHVNLLNAVGGNAKIFLTPYNYSVHKSPVTSKAHYNLLVFGEISNGSAVVDLETQDGFWKVKSASFTPDGGQPIPLEAGNQ